MKSLIKYHVRKALVKDCLVPLSKLFLPFYSGIGSIVMFHRVISNEEKLVCEDLEIKKDFLEKTITYFLENNYKIVSLDEAHEIINNKKSINKKFIVFTFDDGYLDNYTIAYPIFKKYNIPFTIYVTTSFPDKTAKLWWYGLKDLVEYNTKINFSFNENKYHFSTKTIEDKNLAYLEIRSLILSVDDLNLDNLFNIIFVRNGIVLKNYVEKLAMSWSQIKELSEDEIVTIGAHTINHYNLRNLDEEKLRNEIVGSKDRIQSHIKKEVEHFAYPFGSRNEASSREFELIKKLGFKTATTTRCSNIFEGHNSHQNILPRITISPYTETPYIEHYSKGLIPAIRNKFKRVVTD
ncbi:polysaccharide deacetylase family protein [Sporosarcina sp. CAU 1771]